MAGAGKKGKGDQRSGNRVVAQNRKARHDYEILETLEAGMQLVGSEVKSLREGRAQMRDSYARLDDGELWVYGIHVPPYSFSQGWSGHDPDRRRKLLLHRREIEELGSRVNTEQLSLVPLAMYFKDGRAKLELALARGRKTYDKRRAIAARDDAREVARALRARQRGEE